MYDLTNEGFSAQVGEKRIVFRNENFRDGGNEYEGEAIITEKGRLLFVIRFRTQADWKTRPILIDGEGEEVLVPLFAVTKEDLKLRIGIFGAEPWTEKMRYEIENRLGIRAIDIYGLSEIMGPGVSMECLKCNGLHIDENFYPEVLDAEGNVLPEGEPGELVFTSLDKMGFPVLRYRTKDLTSLSYGTCECGHVGWTMQRVSARVDDMLIIRGVNVFPSQIEEAILSVSGVEPHYLIIVDRHDNLDTLEVLVELSADSFTDEIRELELLQANIEDKIEEVIGLSVKVRLVEPKSIPRSEGKAKRVEDRRKGKM